MKKIFNKQEGMNEEEAQILVATINKVRDATEAYSTIHDSMRHDTKTMSKRFCQDHLVMSAILEAFFIKNEISFKELNENIYSNIPKNISWNIAISQINLIIAKMIRLGLIIAIKTENEYNPNFRITEDGVKAYQNQTYQILASSSFFNYQTYLLNKKANWIAILMALVTVISVIVAITATINNLK